MKFSENPLSLQICRKTWKVTTRKNFYPSLKVFCHNRRFGSRIGEPSSARKKNVLCSVWTKIRVSRTQIAREYQCDKLSATRVYRRGHLCYLQHKTTELLPWSKTSFHYLPVADPGEGPGGAGSPLIFRLNKKFIWPPPPPYLTQGLDDPHPLHLSEGLDPPLPSNVSLSSSTSSWKKT